ncbi:Gmad2 immunoglobulin-like domain-containing protein [Patescibacteria group bacterium]|nr:Gmad2 immunoglobulin-like domain-containing protein [Patescibacteria group bacterium]MCG2694846.1 Gmad2 immunoglobulin-like domain-containing protein [Candidatus Parcubacteria bacterium]
MNKFIKIILVAIALVLIIIVIRGDEDTWICSEGKWVKHGAPSSPMPIELCEDKEDKSDLIILETPQPEQEITSPLVIKGEARGNWFFEATFPVVLVDWDGRIIAESYATAKGDWMTTDFVSFEAVIEFEKPEFIGEFSKRGALILKKDNPSGLPENDDALEITIYFKQ